MTMDSGTREPAAPAPNLWRLPHILGVEARYMKYPQPRLHVVGTRVEEVPEGVEITIETDEDFPLRALSPALYVGNVELTDVERIGERRYRFYAHDVGKLRNGAAISVGWIGHPERRSRTRFRYEAEERSGTR